MHTRDVRALIHETRHNGVRLWVEKGELRYKAPKGEIPENLRAALRARRGDLIGALTKPDFRKRGRAPQLVRYPTFWRDYWEETQADLVLCNATHVALKLSGDISLERIETALQQLTVRYDVLRSRVELEDGVPCLVLTHSTVAPPDVVDISKVPAVDLPQRVALLVEQAIYGPLDGGQLYRTRIIKISDNEYIVAIVIHHFVGDLVSCWILTDEFITKLRERPRPAALSDEGPLQYADYLLAMSEWLSGEGLRYRLGYWHETMRGAPPVHFPIAHEPSAGVTARLESVAIQIDAALRAGIARTAAAARISVPAVLLAANFAALAMTLSSNDLVVIVLHNGRTTHPALLGLVGLTLNCFPVRMTIRQGMSYAELLASVNDAYLVAEDYQVPWGLLMRSLGEIGVSCVAPIFNYAPSQVYRHTRPASAAAAAATPSRRPARLEVNHIDMVRPEQISTVAWKSHEFHVDDNGTEIFASVKYAPSKYRTASVEEFARSLLSCLQIITKDPTRSLDDAVRAAG
jgi:condensation domain-containing protein/tubulysin polyketide synthase-like protein